MTISDVPRAASLSERVAEEVRAMLGRKRVSGNALARDLGVSPMWVSTRLTGRQEIGLDDLDRIARSLRVGVADLLPTDVRRTGQTKDGTLTGANRLSDNRPSGRPDRAVTTPPGPRRTRRLTHREPIPQSRWVA
jgi:transcriptional regulator with XRE-family HTH domain